MEARATDTNDYPDVDFSELATLVAPTYIREVPQKDVWGTPFLYIGTGENYRIVSAGADKRFDWNARQMDPNAVPTPSESLETDLIFQDGTFIQYPKEADLDY